MQVKPVIVIQHQGPLVAGAADRRRCLPPYRNPRCQFRELDAVRCVGLCFVSRRAFLRRRELPARQLAQVQADVTVRHGLADQRRRQQHGLRRIAIAHAPNQIGEGKVDVAQRALSPQRLQRFR